MRYRIPVRVLLEIGAELEASINDGARPLHVATDHGHVAVVKTLVELGADKDASAVDGATPLHKAAYNGHVDVVTTLVELGADIGALADSGETPLQLSIDKGHHHVARVLRGAMALERSARTKKEAEAKKPTQQAEIRRTATWRSCSRRRSASKPLGGRCVTASLSPSQSSMAPGWMECPSHTD
jgi:hypothetical protein